MAHKNHYKKIFVIGAALFILLAPIGMVIKPGVVFAQSTTSGTPVVAGASTGAIQAPSMNLLDCLKSPATCGVYYTSLVVNGAMGLLLTGSAWLVKLGLQFNDNIFNSPAVQTGFSVSLAIANLGFVLGIIIIAIATIIRNQTYGIKQLLWKLVFMAILVNFGLVIVAPIVGFANNMSAYFINATSPSVATGGYAAYVETMMTAFAPQKLNAASVASQSTFCNSIASYDPAVYSVCHILGQSTKSPPASADVVWQNTMALLFDIVFSGIAAFTFLCLAVLLIIRYLILGGLLIVLPLAWLTYVFPKFDNSFSKWWNTFVKWTFFPPLALFFIYLAFITAVNTNNSGAAGTATNKYIAVATGGTGTDVTQEKSITTQTGITGDVLAQAADEILLVGLMIMGLMFASTLAGKAGSTAVNMGTSASKAVGGYALKSASKGARKGARAGFNAMGGRNLTKNMRTGDIVPQRLKNIPLVGWAAQKATGAAGRALEPALNNKEYLEAAKKRVPENPEEIKENLRNSGLSTEDRLAHLSKLIEKGEIDNKTMVGSQTAKDYMDSHSADLQNYAFGKSQKDADKVFGSNKEMRDAAKNLKAAGTNVAAAANAMADLDTATKTFVEKLQKTDISKMNVNDAFGDSSELAQALTRGLLNHAPQLVSSALPKMKSPALRNFEKLYMDAYDNESRKALGNQPRLDELAKRRDAFQASLANNALFSAADMPPSTTPAPTPTSNP